MNSTERNLINQLFEKISQTAAQSPNRDREAAQLINQQTQRIPGATYYMAQTIVAQRQALKQAEARLAQLESQLGVQPGGPQSFLAPQPNYGPGYGYPGYGAPQPYGYGYNQPMMGGGGGFLAGAAQTALGIAGGVLLANVAVGLFEGVGDLFSDVPADIASFGSDIQQGVSDFGSDFANPADFGGGDFGGGDFGGGTEW